MTLVLDLFAAVEAPPSLKRCSTCGNSKLATAKSFGRCAKSADGFRGVCLECRKSDYRANIDVNRTKARENYRRNPTKVCEQKKAKRRAEPEATKAYQREHYWRAPDRQRATARRSYHTHKDACLARGAIWRAANKTWLQNYNRAWRAAHWKEYYLKNREKLLAAVRDRHARNRDQLREKARTYYADNREKERARGRRYHNENKEANSARNRRWRLENPEKYRKAVARWMAANKDQARERYRRYQRYRYESDIEFRLRQSIRAGIRYMLRRASVSGSATRTAKHKLGYTIAQLRAHIERQFLRGMSWDNYGKWHIDHILPISSFVFASADDPEVRAAWALTNLRPMWGLANISKGAKRLTLL
jgi:hypothetical protein